MKKLVSVATLAALGAITTAHGGVIENTGATLGSFDPSWSVMWRGIGLGGTSFGSLANAPIVTTIPSPPWQSSIPGINNWIGANSRATIGASGDGSHRYEYAFTTEINLAADSLVTGALGYDNFFIGGFIDGGFDTATGTYTRGTQFVSPTSLLGPGKEDKAGFCRDGDGFLPSSSFPTCTVDFAFNLAAGIYKITFVIQGDGVTDAFLLNQKGVTVVPQPTRVPEPATLTLVGISLLGLAGVARRKRRESLFLAAKDKDCSCSVR